MLRRDYDHKFVCEQCGETIFVFGIKPRDTSVCVVCRVLAGGQKNQAGIPKEFKFHEGLRALVALDKADENGEAESIQCIYLDADGNSQTEADVT